MWPMRYKALRLLCLLLLINGAVLAQGTADKGCKPPKNRELWHDRIDREQKNILKADGRTDLMFAASADEDINYLITQTVIQRVDALQCSIEKDSSASAQKKSNLPDRAGKTATQFFNYLSGSSFLCFFFSGAGKCLQ